MSSTRDLIEFAKAHGGIVTTREAVAIGVDRSVLARRVRDGVLVRVQNGVMALPGTATRSDLLLRAAVRGLSAVVSHHSAARLHRMNPVEERVPTVSVPHRTTNRFEGVQVHQLTDLVEDHVTTVEEVRTTNPERTLIDLSATMSEARLSALMEDALDRGVVDGDRLQDLFTALARRGKPGVRRMRNVLDQTISEQAATESVLERRFLKLIKSVGLPEPHQQYTTPWLRPTHGRADFAYPDARLIIEVDGRRWHAKTQAFETDRRRDNEAQLAGWRVLRFTWDALESDASGVVGAVRFALQDHSGGDL